MSKSTYKPFVYNPDSFGSGSQLDTNRVVKSSGFACVNVGHVTPVTTRMQTIVDDVVSNDAVFESVCQFYSEISGQASTQSADLDSSRANHSSQFDIHRQ